jgi:hypothetical protein
VARLPPAGQSPKKLPKNYVGADHQTIGSDILSILKVCTMPRQVLGNELTERLEKVKANEWYPIEVLLEPMEILGTRIGYAGLLQMGRALFKLSHEAGVRQNAKSAGDVIFGIDGMYHHANRGEQIGGWKVTSFHPGYAVMEKTTPHYCWMEEGILSEAFHVVGVAAFVAQTACLRQGADACIFQVTSLIRDARWMGNHAPVGPLPPGQK